MAKSKADEMTIVEHLQSKFILNIYRVAFVCLVEELLPSLDS